MVAGEPAGLLRGEGRGAAPAHLWVPSAPPARPRPSQEGSGFRFLRGAQVRPGGVAPGRPRPGLRSWHSARLAATRVAVATAAEQPAPPQGGVEFPALGKCGARRAGMRGPGRLGAARPALAAASGLALAAGGGVGRAARRALGEGAKPGPADAALSPLFPAVAAARREGRAAGALFRPSVSG